MKELLGWAVKADIASLQKVIAVLRTKIESGRPQKPGTIFGAMDHRSLHEARTEQVRHILSASTALQMYAASCARVTNL